MERIRWRHSSCLWFQMLGVEALSFLPEDQRDGCNFARQGQARHLRPHSLGHQTIVKLLERSGLGSGHRGGTLEQILQIVIVIAIQPTNRRRLLRALQLSLDVKVLGAAVCLNPKPAVGPELSLGTKPVRCLDQSDQQSRIGPMNGIARSNFQASCFWASVNSSRRTSWRKDRNASNCW